MPSGSEYNARIFFLIVSKKNLSVVQKKYHINVGREPTQFILLPIFHLDIPTPKKRKMQFSTIIPVLTLFAIGAAASPAPEGHHHHPHHHNKHHDHDHDHDHDHHDHHHHHHHHHHSAIQRRGILPARPSPPTINQPEAFFKQWQSFKIDDPKVRELMQNFDLQNREYFICEYCSSPILESYFWERPKYIDHIVKTHHRPKWWADKFATKTPNWIEFTWKRPQDWGFNRYHF